jgi:hypothetical protein
LWFSYTHLHIRAGYYSLSQHPGPQALLLAEETGPSSSDILGVQRDQKFVGEKEEMMGEVGRYLFGQNTTTMQYENPRE